MYVVFCYSSLKSSLGLGQCFVNLNYAEALFNKAPSHYTFFGSSSVDTAVTQAVSDSKINKDLIVMPKK